MSTDGAGLQRGQYVRVPRPETGGGLHCRRPPDHQICNLHQRDRHGERESGIHRETTTSQVNLTVSIKMRIFPLRGGCPLLDPPARRIKRYPAGWSTLWRCVA